MLYWTCSAFEALSGAQVYEMLALRSQVFVIEQQCLYLDLDGLDADCWHLFGRDAAGFGVDAFPRDIVPAAAGRNIGQINIMHSAAFASGDFIAKSNDRRVQAQLQNGVDLAA